MWGGCVAAGADFRARIFHPEDLKRVREQRQAALARGLPFEIEQRALRKDRQYRFLIRYAGSSQPMAGPSFWMKSESCPWNAARPRR